MIAKDTCKIIECPQTENEYAEIERERCGFAAGSGDLADGGVERFLVTRAENDAGAVSSQTKRDGASDSTAGAGDYCYFAVEGRHAS